MTLEEAKQFIALHSDPAQMTVQELETYKLALAIISTAWAVMED